MGPRHRRDPLLGGGLQHLLHRPEQAGGKPHTRRRAPPGPGLRAELHRRCGGQALPVLLRLPHPAGGKRADPARRARHRAGRGGGAGLPHRDHPGHHRKKTRRGADQAFGLLRRADRAPQPPLLPAAAGAGAGLCQQKRQDARRLVPRPGPLQAGERHARARRGGPAFAGRRRPAPALREEKRLPRPRRRGVPPFAGFPPGGGRVHHHALGHRAFPGRGEGRTAHPGGGLGPLLAGGAGGVRLHQHRYQPLPLRCLHRERPDQERGRRHVSGEGAGQKRLPDLRRVDERQGLGADHSGEPAAQGVEGGGIHHPLPAPGLQQQRRGGRHRGASASRRWCAGTARSSAWSSRAASSPLPRRSGW